MKVGIIGAGNRAAHYIGAIRAMREDFEIVSMHFRNPEKADLFHRRYGIPATLSMDEFKSAKPDFVINTVTYHEIAKVSVDLLKDSIPVLAETPAAPTPAELNDLWTLASVLKSKILVAENYFEEPMYAAIIEAVRRGMIGDIQTAAVSSTHDYHAASLMRIILGAENEAFTVIGKKMDLDLVTTQNIDSSPVRNGEIGKAERYHVIINFSGGKTGFYDFAIAQYWSAIRSTSFVAQGSKGEIKDGDIWYIAKNGNPVKTQLRSVRDPDGGLVSIAAGDVTLYENKLRRRGINNDIGICNMLLNMKRYLETGVAVYPFASAAQDAYMMHLFQECGRRPFELIASEKMPWHTYS